MPLLSGIGVPPDCISIGEGNYMRYGLLARVSGEEQVEGYSLDAQVRAFNTLVETRGVASITSGPKKACPPAPTTSRKERSFAGR